MISHFLGNVPNQPNFTKFVSIFLHFFFSNSFFLSLEKIKGRGFLFKPGGSTEKVFGRNKIGKFFI